ncbi:hypothetical protein [cf. Phormidesmis sp. LEGE 11477]|uniref:hypothetical protein n=1 Tax=cf. Phormidesmis sp. LEGE 11477 TaxID=1828680 RepID=UPI00187F238E|nr:hypothetical protein [cf. Phormidesmis sp. LEGE 11477]MBE9063371.1 hypothetical protein [cf. Phormidesmis sp. LEGE 11477]
MQYLAKVHAKQSHNTTQLQLLARNSSENLWELLVSQSVISTAKDIPFSEQMLLIAEIEDNNQVISVVDATEWVLGIVKDYLSLGVTPEELKGEIERAEQWRQSLTLQSQEVRRRTLETAARRDEIQNLEKRLKLDRETPDSGK